MYSVCGLVPNSLFSLAHLSVCLRFFSLFCLYKEVPSSSRSSVITVADSEDITWKNRHRYIKSVDAMSSDPFDEELLALASNPFSDDPSISLTSLSSIAPLISQQQPQPQHLQQLQQKHHLHQQSYSIPLQDHDLTDYPSTKQLSSSSTPASQSGTLRFQLSYRDPKNLPSEAIKLLNDALGPNVNNIVL